MLGRYRWQRIHLFGQCRRDWFACPLISCPFFLKLFHAGNDSAALGRYAFAAFKTDGPKVRANIVLRLFIIFQKRMVAIAAAGHAVQMSCRPKAR
jgi:hypothetical protein